MKNKFFDKIVDNFWYLVFDGQRFLGPTLILTFILRYFFFNTFFICLGIIISILLIVDILYLWHYDYKKYQEVPNKSKLKNPWWLYPWHILYPFICLIPCILYLCGYSIKSLIITLFSFILNAFVVVYYDEENSEVIDSLKW